MTNVFRIRKPDDFHIHLRQGKMLVDQLPIVANTFSRVMAMPNLEKPVQNAIDMKIYQNEIRHAWGYGKLQTLHSIYFTSCTSIGVLRSAREHGAVAFKVYPPELTTNAELGVSNILDFDEELREMERLGLVLQLHPETKTPDYLDQEVGFIPTVQELARRYPALRIVVEHVTTAKMVRLIKELPPTVAATITVHHLMLTLGDVLRGKIRPHNYCAPVAKKVSDRQSLNRAAMSGNSKFFLGTDSAPHPIGKKECAEGCAGIYTAPMAMELLIELFENKGRLGRLQAFTSEFGAQFYGLELNQEYVNYEQRPWTVPQDFAGVRPFMAGQELQWQKQQQI